MNTPQILITSALAIRSFCILSAPVMAEGIQRCGTITIGRPNEPLTLDPFVPSDDGSIYAIAQICEPLVSADKLGTGLVPALPKAGPPAKMA
ncbi:MAG: hypothetical protein H7245_21510 [Candidatus Saccharibacteria bacterium]|nr:hypothetical protein [Pseudorhodobacter sp.]